MAAVHGDNIVDRSANMPWYEGPALLAFLEEVDLHEHDCDAPLRFPVQHVLRPQSHPFQDYRGYAGTVAWGCVRQGDEVVVLPSGVRTRVSSVDLFETTVDRATAGHAVALRLVDDIDIGRGHLIADPDRPPVMTGRFTADICWMNDEAPLRPGQQFWLKHSTRRVRCRVESLDSRLDIDTMTAEGRPPEFALNDIGQVTIQTMEPLFVDPYVDSRATGSFILIDTATYRTVGAGMISDPSGIAAGGAADAAV
jgi:sulfate adenylyltransferase subunit 1 (EFTu-like GTPase family)